MREKIILYKECVDSLIKYGELMSALEALKQSAIVYVYDMNKSVTLLIECLISMDYTDITESGGKTHVKDFRYIICKDGRFIKLYARIHDDISITFINYSNIIPGNRIEIMRSYGGDTLEKAMQISIEELKMYGMSDTNTTIGSVSMNIFKDSIKYDYNKNFPLSIYKEKAEPWMKYCKNIADFIRMSYAGGWNYLNPVYQNKKIDNGIVYDGNSLYPYCLANFRYPVGNPLFKWKGKEPDYIEEYEGFIESPLYRFIMIKTMFHVKHNRFPFIKIKNDLRYKQNEVPEKVDCPTTLVLTQTDYELMLDTYDIDAIEYIGGIAFATKPGKELFGDYIDKLYDIKTHSTGAKKKTAKLLMNNIGGKFGGGCDSTHYIYDPSQASKYRIVFGNDRQGQYIPVASAMTAYGRKYTILGALANKDKFIYSDTDSIHLNGTEEANGIYIDDTELGAWKRENVYTEGYYSRLKSYSYKTDKPVEYITDTDIIEKYIKYVNAGYTDAEKLSIIEDAESAGKEPGELMEDIYEKRRKEIKEETEKLLHE